ncbi:endonuclease III domain-containing protein [Bifidobacterium psychraerophilum]|uniref:endonuclease III domain-containing protein n=1 Tax=Bifidobacterium psychraerophilum TaxID=218140 RepID=UPI0039EC37C7
MSVIAKHVPGEEISIRDVFSMMLEAMGPSHWWPAESRFEIMVGAVLTQNTAWGNVARSLDALKQARVLEPDAMLSLDPGDLQELIRPSGFQKNKSRALHDLCAWYGDRCGFRPEGAEGIEDEELRSELLSVFGVGGETADDLLLYVFDREAFIADTYARRLFGFLGQDVPKGYEAFRNRMLPEVRSYAFTVVELQEFHGLIDQYGKSHRSPEAMKDSFLGNYAARFGVISG